MTRHARLSIASLALGFGHQRVTRESRSVIALALASMGLVACGSTTPMSPSSLSAREAAPDAVSASVSSDTIKITRGTLALQSGLPGSVTLQGSHGFRFGGRTLSGLEPSAYCGSFNPCAPGATVSFTATWSGSDLPGTVRVQGDEFPVGGLDERALLIEMTGSFVAPAHLTDTALVTVPFVATGLLSSTGFQLTGSGQVTFTLEWQSVIDGWAIRFTSFDFGKGSPAEG
jgi:hypothetical protein